MALLVGSMFAYFYSFFEKQSPDIINDFIIITKEGQEQEPIGQELIGQKLIGHESTRQESTIQEPEPEVQEYNHKIMHDKKRKNDSKKKQRQNRRNKK
jgi:hypothetical protein